MAVIRTAVVIGFIVLAAGALGEAGTLTVETTPEQDAALALLLKQTNKGRDTPLTAKEFLDYVTAQWLDSLTTKASEDDKTALRGAWEKADKTQRDQIKAILGVQE